MSIEKIATLITALTGFVLAVAKLVWVLRCPV
jgi:hypothetical protein